jgi:hypothetical protein
MFEVKIVVYSIFDQNNVMFSSIFNSKFKKKIEIIGVVENEEVFYGSLFSKEFMEKLLNSGG